MGVQNGKAQREMVVIDTLIQRKEVVSKTENREVKHPQKKYFDTKKTSCLKNSLSKSKSSI